ncbi:MAG: EAL domain-containing protein, partial [Chromatiaceae bacterium]|nr:EAL domain-containing protein [Chromatiaceae bacterium]
MNQQRHDSGTGPPLASDPLVRRARAEAELYARGETSTEPPSLEEAQALVHELRVHQIELEHQNEALRQSQIELEESRARYFELYDLAPVGYLTLSPPDLIEEANRAAEALLGMARANLIKRPLSQFIDSRDRALYQRAIQAPLAHHFPQRGEFRLQGSRKPPGWILLQAAPGALHPAQPNRRHVALIDISARKHNEQALLDSQARLRLATEVAGLSFWEWDWQEDRLYPPPAGFSATRTDGETSAEPRLSDWAAALHEEDRDRALAAIRAFAAHPDGPRELQYRATPDGVRERWFLSRLESLRDGAGQPRRLLLVQQDITHRKQAEDEALYLAQHDPLTGLASRALLDQLATHMLASARRANEQLAVLFFDLDRFKVINDTHGHGAGDRVLQGIARRLRACFRAEDLIARMGGDEFVVVARIHDADEAARTARKAIAILEPPHAINGLSLRCLPSIGISLFPRDGETLDALLQRADIAMYQAKRISPGHYQFVTESLNRKVEAATSLEQRLREALAHGEFSLAYQPMLDIASGQVNAVEALLRWPQPEGEPIPPGTIIPLAESLHLIHEIGHWVFGECCRQLHAWRQAQLPPLGIAINISTRQFYHPRFIADLTATLRDTHTDPRCFSLQISEATLLESLDSAKLILAELRALGARLVMDDFGLGCSSLCELEGLALDGLAIDRALIQRLGLTASMPAIVNLIIHLSHALHLEVTAVGIESESDLAFVREQHCDRAQGHYIGMPLSGAEFIAWHRQQTRCAAGPP